MNDLIISKIKKKNVDGVLISSLPNIIYLTGFSGFSSVEREAFLLITGNKQYVLTDGRYKEAVLNKIPEFEFIEINSKNTIETCLKNLFEKHKVKKLGIEEHNLSVLEYKRIRKIIKNLKDFNLNKLRILKTADEIENIKKACTVTDKTFEYILGKIKEGITEKKLALEIELHIREANAELSFPPIAAFGENSSIPHHQPSNRKLNNNEQVLLDFGAKINNYCSDMTRTVFIGKASDEQKRMYKTVLEAQEKAIEFLYGCHSKLRQSDEEAIFNQQSRNKILRLKTQDNKLSKTPEIFDSERQSFHAQPRRDDKSTKASDVDAIARNYIVEQGYPTIPHSVGHGIGIEVHEGIKISPKSKDIIKPGMVFSIEPGIYLPKIGGARIEDLILLKKNGIEILTKSVKELVEI